MSLDGRGECPSPGGREFLFPRAQRSAFHALPSRTGGGGTPGERRRPPAHRVYPFGDERREKQNWNLRLLQRPHPCGDGRGERESESTTSSPGPDGGWSGPTCPATYWQ